MSSEESAAALRHSIEVVREPTTGHVQSVRFVCHGSDASPCHWWPGCDCEEWGPEHGSVEVSPSGKREHVALPGHEAVQQESCWVDPWFNDALSEVADWVDAYADEPPQTFNADGEDHLEWLISGYIETKFEGDYMTWEYALPSLDQPLDFTTPTLPGDRP